MDKVAAIIIGALFGVGQFFIMRHTLKPLEKGENLQVSKTMLLRLPLPLILLGGCALIDYVLLAYAGGAFCAGLIGASVVNHLWTPKRRDDA